MYTLLSILVLLWLVGFLTHVGGDAIHALLVVAGVLFIFQLITGRNAV
jgi:hypothetical protein